MKSRLHVLAPVLAVTISSFVFIPGVSSGADADTVSVSLAEAAKLLEGLPNLEAKSEEEVRQIIDANPDIRRRVEQAERKVRAAMDEMGVSRDSEALSQALKELESIAELQGKTDEEIAKIVESNPDVRRRVSSAGRRISSAMGGSGEVSLAEADEATDRGGETSLVPDEVDPTVAFDGSSTNVLDDVFFGEFEWVFGGFKGQKAEKSPVQIAGLSMKRDGLSFKYVEDLSSWGLSHGDYSGALACLFVCDNDGRWVGGKFDWISSSRKTRDFKNIYSGYEGWSLRNVPNPCAAAFVIVSKNGRKRSNVITAMWER